MSLILYINGQQADLKAGQAIAQTRQVNDLNSLENRQASYTNKFSLPKTAHNLKLLDHLTVTGNTSRIPYQKNKCSLYSESGECFIYNGWAVITDGGDDFEAVVYDGIIDLYKAIENTTLGSLDLTEIKHEKTVGNIISSWTNDKYRYILGDYNGMRTYRTGFGVNRVTRINADYLIPSVNIAYLWDKIFSTYNFTYSGSVFQTQNFKNLWMTFPKGLQMSEGTTQLLSCQDYTYQRYGNHDYAYFAKCISPQVNDGLTLVNNMHMRVAQAGYYRVKVSGKLHTTTTQYFPWGVHYPGLKSHVFISKNTSATGADAAQPLAVLYDGLNSETDFESSVLLNLQANETMSIVIKRSAQANGQYGFTLQADNTLEVVVERLNISLMDFGAALSDFSTRDFLTEIVHRFGLTMFKDKYRNHYEFLTLQEILQTSDAADWSSKFARKESESYTYGNYAQQNWLRYNYNNKDSSYYDSQIAVDDKNLPDTRDIIKSKMYAPELDKRSFMGRMTNIYKFWEPEAGEPDEDGGITITYKPLDKRYYLMRSVPYTYQGASIGSYTLGGSHPSFTTAPSESYSGLSFADVVENYYSNIRQVINKALIITVSLYLTEADIAGFSFRKLYYFRQLGAYFIMNKISNYIPGKLTKCEMVRVALVSDQEFPAPAPSITIEQVRREVPPHVLVKLRIDFSIANFVMDSGEVLHFEVSNNGSDWLPKGTTPTAASPCFLTIGANAYYTYMRIRYGSGPGLISNTYAIQW